MKKYLLFFFFNFFFLAVWAQKDTCTEFYPAQPPFSLLKASERGYNKTAIRVARYQKTENDETGLQWSIPIGYSYQKEMYSYFDGDLEKASFFDTLEQAIEYWEYFYREGLVSGVEYYQYEWEKNRENKEDSTRQAKLKYTWAYIYQADRKPFQKTQVFEECKTCRILHDYLWDEKGRIQREKQRTTGFPKEPIVIQQPKTKKKQQPLPIVEQKLPPVIPERLILTEYDESTVYQRTYLDMHQLEQTVEWVLNDEGQKIIKKIFIWANNEKQLTSSTNYSYSDGKLVKEEENTFLDKDTWGLSKRTYYKYLDQDLPEQIIIEKGEYQEIWDFIYMK